MFLYDYTFMNPSNLHYKQIEALDEEEESLRVLLEKIDVKV